MTNFLKKTWLACWLLAFSADSLVVLGWVKFSETAVSEWRLFLEPLLFCSALPSSLPYTILHAQLVCNRYGCYQQFEFWLGVFVAGYAQWFVLVPRLFGRRSHGLNLLDLSAPSHFAQARGARGHREAE